MNKSTVWGIIVLLLAIGIVAFLYVTRAPSAPSESISSVAASLDSGTSTSGTVYSVDASSSVVTFGIDEVLRGKPNHVVGTSTEIAGNITIEDNAITFGKIEINARTFVTDSSMRNGSIERLILHSDNDANQFITFEPTSVTGTPPSLASGTNVNLQVTGDLTISGVTKPETFTVVGTINNDSITGTASATLSRADFGLIIPNIPFVANVPDTFTIQATIVAKKVTQ